MKFITKIKFKIRYAWERFRVRVLKRPPRFLYLHVPNIIRVSPQLIAQQIVGIQPLSGATTLGYYLRHRHALSRGLMRSVYPISTPETVNWKKEGF